MKKVMIATGNKNKVREYKEMLEPLGYEVHDLSEIESKDVEETGTTFAENALIKARAVKCDMMVIADDSGLEVKALNNEPGIYSARYLAGHDYHYKNAALIERLKEKNDRSARFCCAIALVDGDVEKVFEGTMEGSIGFEEKGTNGFGYDPIFIPKGYNCSSAELQPQEKNRISHRGKATQGLLTYLKEGK